MFICINSVVILLATAVVRAHFVGFPQIRLRPLQTLLIRCSWTYTPAVTIMGDFTHLMSPFCRRDVNLALLDGVALAGVHEQGYLGDVAFVAA